MTDDKTFPRSGFVRFRVAPWFIKMLEEERERDLEVMAEQFTAHAHITHTVDDRVFGTLHYPHDDPAWYERTPSWILQKMQDLTLLRARERVTEERVEKVLRRLVRKGRLDVASRGDVFYKARLM